MTRNSKHGRVGPEHRTHGCHVNSRATITACSINHMISNLVRIQRIRSSEDDRNKENVKLETRKDHIQEHKFVRVEEKLQ